MPPLTLATFNINNIAKRLAVLLEWLTKASPDIVCLQELKVPDTRFPLREIEAAGYGARWVGQPSWSGVAILAKGMTPVETRRQLPGLGVWTTRLCAAMAGVDCCGRDRRR